MKVEDSERIKRTGEQAVRDHVVQKTGQITNLSKKVSFQKIDCGIINSKDDKEEDSSISSAKNFMNKTAKPSATYNAHLEVIVTIPIKPGQSGNWY